MHPGSADAAAGSSRARSEGRTARLATPPIYHVAPGVTTWPRNAGFGTGRGSAVLRQPRWWSDRGVTIGWPRFPSYRPGRAVSAMGRSASFRRAPTGSRAMSSRSRPRRTGLGSLRLLANALDLLRPQFLHGHQAGAIEAPHRGLVDCSDSVKILGGRMKRPKQITSVRPLPGHVRSLSILVPQPASRRPGS